MKDNLRSAFYIATAMVSLSAAPALAQSSPAQNRPPAPPPAQERPTLNRRPPAEAKPQTPAPKGKPKPAPAPPKKEDAFFQRVDSELRLG